MLLLCFQAVFLLCFQIQAFGKIKDDSNVLHFVKAFKAQEDSEKGTGDQSS